MPYEVTIRLYCYDEPDLQAIADDIEDEFGYTVIDEPTVEEV
jgi:hypothetical protein